MNKKRLLVMAGGTGGHIFPGIAVANVLKKQGWEIRWLGTPDRMEADLVPQHHIDIDFIQVSGLRGTGFAKKLKSPLMILHAIYQAKKHMTRWQPDVVLGMGGYVCGPGGVAAYLMGIPLVIHEQNAVAGLTNRWLSKLARRTLQAFPTAFPHQDVVGNPVREDLCQLTTGRSYQEGEPLNILVMGGSQGAQILNNTVPLALSKVSRPFRVRHQAGRGRCEETVAKYQAASLADVDVTEFIDNVVDAYTWADIIICRSGALTVSELAVAGVPAIFVPFQHADRQQALNAEYLVNQDAAIMIEQHDLTPERLAEELQSLNASRLLAMSEAAQKVAIRNAADRVASVLIDAAKKREKVNG